MITTVIFVDDDRRCIESIRRSLSGFHECSNWNIFFFSDPHQALTEASNAPVSALVTDEHMPGMSGHELIQAMKKLHPHMFSILLTGDSDLAPAKDTILLEKPFSTEDLIRTIGNVLNSTSHGDSHE